MKIALITGGAGFIGSHLADRLLSEGFKVRILDDLSTGKLENIRGDFEFIEGSILDTEIVEKSFEGVDVCFHLAAIASVERSNLEWFNVHSNNMGGAVRVFEGAVLEGKRRGVEPIPVIYASSAAVYGDIGEVAISEDMDLRPLSAYGADKLGMEQHALVGGGVHNLRSFGFRFFNIYGPRQDPHSPYSGVISAFVNMAKEGKGLIIHGDGEQSRDFVFVGDLVDALIESMSAVSIDAPIVNICRGKSVTIKELAEIVNQIAGSDIELSFIEARRGDIRYSLGDDSKVRAVLEWEAKTGLEEGLRAVFEQE